VRPTPHFPYLDLNNHKDTSPQTPNYNCIAWAAGETHRRWWPQDPEWMWYWPADVPRIGSVDNFVRAFSALGYRSCSGAELELGWEKLALYIDAAGAPKHMARQLPSGKWTSKLGPSVDIEHDTPATLEGPTYGQALHFLKRSNPNFGLSP
jgi:hypothetical protein